MKATRKLAQLAEVIAAASNYRVLTSSILVWFYWLMFNLVESMIERLVFGEAFLHWLDPFIALAFIVLSGFVAIRCAIYRIENEDES